MQAVSDNSSRDEDDGGDERTDSAEPVASFGVDDSTKASFMCISALFHNSRSDSSTDETASDSSLFSSKVEF